MTGSPAADAGDYRTRLVPTWRALVLLPKMSIGGCPPEGRPGLPLSLERRPVVLAACQLAARQKGQFGGLEVDTAVHTIAVRVRVPD